MSKTIYTRYLSAEYKRRLCLEILAAFAVGFCIGHTLFDAVIWVACAIVRMIG